MTKDASDACASTSEQSTSARPAWQPLTPRGVAAFAHATFRRLFLVEMLVSFLAAGAVVWFLSVDWFPVIRQAIHRLPAEGTIQAQTLDLPVGSVQILAENRPFLVLVLNLERQPNASQTSDMLVELRRKNFQFCSILGCMRLNYPSGANLQFNRTSLAALWEAWQPIVLVLVALSVILFLLASWSFLATLYCGFIRLLGFYEDRDLDWGSSWRLASAALMPGALVLSAGIFCYALGVVDLIRLLLLFALHLVVGWLYAAISPFFVRRLASILPPGANPFTPKTLQ